MRIDQLDEATVKLITEVVLRVLSELNAASAVTPTYGAPLPAPTYGAPQTTPTYGALQTTPGGSSCCQNQEAAYISGKGSGKNLITEREVIQLAAKKQTELVCPKNTIITPLAADRLKAEGITVVRE